MQLFKGHIGLVQIEVRDLQPVLYFRGLWLFPEIGAALLEAVDATVAPPDDITAIEMQGVKQRVEVICHHFEAKRIRKLVKKG